MDRAEAERRDRVLRAYFEGRDWDEAIEAKLARELVLGSAEVLPAFPFVVDYEWDVVPGKTNNGRGDLVFADGDGGFAVVEVKSILGSGKNTNRRTKVEDQAARYLRAAQARCEGNVVAFVYTDDPMCPGLRTPSTRRPGLLPADTEIGCPMGSCFPAPPPACPVKAAANLLPPARARTAERRGGSFDLAATGIAVRGVGGASSAAEL